MASNTWKVVQAHIPMIKFRKGGPNIGRTSSTPSESAGLSGGSSSKGSSGPRVTVLPIIEDFQLPLRFQRRPISDKEMAYINRGGPE